jgi:non-canonical (house-cleaning) NTP pyrophosphatase
MSKRKIEVAEKVIRQLFLDTTDINMEGYAAASGVPETPYDAETFCGAQNRAHEACVHMVGADHYIGLESGLVERYGHIYEEAWSVVLTADGKEYAGYSSGLKVPDYVLQKMDELKIEHNEVMTILEEEHGKLANDTWGNYSGGMLIREVSLEEAIRNALIQIVAPQVSFFKKK